MRGSVPMLLAVAVLAGCGRTPKVDNPVLGPPPPRVSLSDPDPGGAAYVNDPLDPQVADAEAGEIVRAALVERAARDDQPGAAGARVVANVNGEPIFEGDVLEPYRGHFEERADQLSEAQMKRLRRELVERDLESHVDRLLLVQAVKRQFKAEQVEQVEQRLDELFADELKKMYEKHGVGSQYELARKLEREGQSLDALRRSFHNQQLAMLYLGQNAQREFEIGRNDLLEYYDEHIADYTIEEEVRWQRLQVKFADHGGKNEALAHLEKAIDDLRAGVPFGDVARKFSDGSRAASGGHWDWTKQGSLKDERVEQALFSLPVGLISQVFVDEDSYQIVQVTERREAGFVPFEDVQDEIREAVETELRKRETDRVLAELRETAEITSTVDGDRGEEPIELPFR